MIDRRMIGKYIYERYEFRTLGPGCRDLYTYLVLNADNDGICDKVYEIMTLNRSSNNDIRSLMEAEFVLPIMNDTAENIVVWLPDFLLINVIKRPKKYSPSIYRAQLRQKYPWAPLLVVWDAAGNIRDDIINNNDNIPPDPRTGLIYKTPQCQIPTKIRKNKNNSFNKIIQQNYDIAAIEAELLGKYQ